MNRTDILKRIDYIVHQYIHFGKHLMIQESTNTWHDLKFRHQDIHILEANLESYVSHNAKINFKFRKQLSLFDRALTIGKIIDMILEQVNIKTS
jgi:hypothetical protein